MLEEDLAVGQVPKMMVLQTNLPHHRPQQKRLLAVAQLALEPQGHMVWVPSCLPNLLRERKGR